MDIKKNLPEDNNPKKYLDKPETPSGSLDPSEDSNFPQKSASVDTIGKYC